MLDHTLEQRAGQRLRQSGKESRTATQKVATGMAQPRAPAMAAVNLATMWSLVKNPCDDMKEK